MTTTSIRALRQTLVQAKREGGSRLLAEITRGLHDLARSRYRCCLVDFESCRPAFYVRVLHYEGSRIKVELEFPIEPRLRAVQWLPLSHLADYDEVEDGESIRDIYRDVSPYLRARTMKLKQREPSSVKKRDRAGVSRKLRRAEVRSLGERGRRRRGTSARVLWGACVAGLLTMMLTFTILAAI